MAIYISDNRINPQIWGDSVGVATRPRGERSEERIGDLEVVTLLVSTGDGQGPPR